MSSTTLHSGEPSASGGLRRDISWQGAFWVASGVPALVLFSIGGIAGLTQQAAFLVWGISMVLGFIQSFTYAEIAGLFPNKSGGASVYGAAAWLKYGKFLAPLSVWCNWLAWTPVLSLGCAIASAYIINALAGALPDLGAWQLFGFSIPGLVDVSIGSTFVIGAILMLIVFAIQHRGILGTAKVQMVVGLLVIIPMLIVGIVPLLTGGVNYDNFALNIGEWTTPTWTLVFGGMFLAAWSTYAFETAICYTSEFKNPARDVFKAIFYSGLLCLVIYTLVPFTFQGVLGVEGMTQPGIVNGDGVAAAMAHMVNGGAFIDGLLQMLMILALLLAIMTAMAGSSRTLYQGSVDGWLPRYLSRTNRRGAPTAAMWTDLCFNLILLSFAASDVGAYFFILAMSNCGYIIFNFLNLHAGWIHRVDSPHIKRPWKAPTILIVLGAVLAYFNAMLMGAGAKTWGSPALLWYGLGAAALALPIFWFRHYVQDKGQFPPHMLRDLGVTAGQLGERRAGVWPYVVLITGLAVMIVAHFVFTLE
jgi:amino acid transporter